MLKKIFIVLCILCLHNIAFADAVYVKPHVTKDGRFVSGHYRSKPNKSKLDNYSSKGNFNPYTLKSGTSDPFSYKKYKVRY